MVYQLQCIFFMIALVKIAILVPRSIITRGLPTLCTGGSYFRIFSSKLSEYSLKPPHSSSLIFLAILMRYTTYSASSPLLSMKIWPSNPNLFNQLLVQSVIHSQLFFSPFLVLFCRLERWMRLSYQTPNFLHFCPRYSKSMMMGLWLFLTMSFIHALTDSD